MKFPENVDENDLIDAFDAPEPQAPASIKSTTASPQRRSAFFRQPTRSNGQKSPKKTKLLARSSILDSFGPGNPVVDTMTPSEPMQQQQMRLQMTDVELQKTRQEIEREMRVFQERFDYVAHVLAGETPHQIEKRKKREEERLVRQEKRHQVVATRLQHQRERLEEREERRARLRARPP